MRWFWGANFVFGGVPFFFDWLGGVAFFIEDVWGHGALVFVSGW